MDEDMIAFAESLKPELSELRRDFHRYPELGWCEMRTTTVIARKLTELGFDEVLVGRSVCDGESRMGVPSADELEAQYARAAKQGADPEFLPETKGGFTGAVGILYCGEGPTVALRFDIDALPLTETADAGHFPAAHGFISENPGVMHACGHDGHITIGLGTATVLTAFRAQLHGTLKLIFQPAEEGVRGARSVVKKGHLDHVDYVLGCHLAGDCNVKQCHIAAGLNSTLATTKLDVTFSGKSSHAGISPQEGHYAILSAATAVLNLHAIPRYGEASTRVNVGKLTAGTGRNLVCDKALLELEVRGDTSAANEYMLDYARRIVNAAALMHGCEAEITTVGDAKCIINTPGLSERVRKAVSEIAGLPVTKTKGGTFGSEDYSYMSECVENKGGQSCYFKNVIPVESTFHNNHFDFDEQALVNGVKAFCAIAMDLMRSV